MKNDKTNIGCSTGCLSLVVALCVIWSVAVYEDTEDLIQASFPLVIMASIIITVAVGIRSEKNKQEKLKAQAEKRKQLIEERARLEMEHQQALEAKFEEDKTQLVARFGTPNRIITVAPTDINNCLIMFGQTSVLYVCGFDVPFEKVISFRLYDDYGIKRGKVEISSDSKKSAKESIALGTAGAVIAGGAGAVIGASMASSKTSSKMSASEDSLIHNYTLAVNVLDANNPLIKFEIGNDSSVAMEVEAVMNYILALRQQ